MLQILITDTETSGMSKKDGICQLGFVEVNPNLEEINRWESLIDPECPITPEASGVHGIVDADVEYAPTMAEAMSQVLVPTYGQFDNILFISHNTPFDRRFLQPYWGIAWNLCTLRLARKLIPQAPNHKLQTLKYFLELEVETKQSEAHSALADSLDVLALLKYLVKLSGADIFDLMGFAARPEKVTHMPFGKHKGTLLEDLPPQYRAWLLGLDDLSDDIRWSLTSK